MDIVESATWRPYGGFSTAVVIDSRFAYLLPDAMLSERAAVLMCAGITVFSPLRSLAGEPGRKVGIIGIGGLGHLAIQFAHALGYEVSAISSHSDKKNEATAFGADEFIIAERDNLKAYEFEFDLLLCTAPSKLDWESLLMSLKKRGQLILVGFPDVAFNSTDLVAHDLSIRGSLLGNHAQLCDMLSFAQDYDIKPIVEVFPMSEVNNVIQRVRLGQGRYRIVLAP